MKTKITIRNCVSAFRFQCPQQWGELTRTESPKIRHCSCCDRDVHYCVTDAETIEHAKAGRCIAREIPDEKGLPLVFLGMPKEPKLPTPQQEEAARLLGRERAIDDSIKNADSDRACPVCKYPAPKWRVTCRICGFEMGRVLEDA